MKYFSIALLNMTVVVCFTILALHFNKWWIITFLVLFLFTSKENNE